MKLIDKATVVAKIMNCIDRCNIKKRSCPANTQVEAICDNKIHAYKEILSFLDALEVKDIETPKVPKHSYFETIYHCGTEPMWKIGDILAIYEFYSDREGEHVYGEVVSVRNDETYDDWIYTMKSDSGEYEDIYENELISQQAYRKNM